MKKKLFKTTSNSHKTGKPAVGWWSGKKPCNCGKETCTRPGGAACVRRAKRRNKNE